MRFEEWQESELLEGGIYTKEYWESECDAAKRAWNAALEEAAQAVEDCQFNGKSASKTIRSLKEES